MSITGKFQLEKNERFFEHLIALGVPEDKARKANSLKPSLEITANGNTLELTSVSEEFSHKSVLTYDEVVEETIAAGLNLKSILTKIDDHIIQVESTGVSPGRGRRRYEFSEKNMYMTIENDDKSIPVAKRIYTRL